MGGSHPKLRRIACAGLWAISAIGLLEFANAAAGAKVGNAGDWPMAARDHASTRFSPLDQISPANVATLKLAFTFSTGVLRGHEAAPIVVGSTMFIVTPYPNVVYALDL